MTFDDSVFWGTTLICASLMFIVFIAWYVWDHYTRLFDFDPYSDFRRICRKCKQQWVLTGFSYDDDYSEIYWETVGRPIDYACICHQHKEFE